MPARRDRTGRLRPLRVPGSRGSAHTLSPPRRLSGGSNACHSRHTPLQRVRGPRIAQPEVDVRNRCARLPVTRRASARSDGRCRLARPRRSIKRRAASTAATRERFATGSDSRHNHLSSCDGSPAVARAYGRLYAAVGARSICSLRRPQSRRACLCTRGILAISLDCRTCLKSSRSDRIRLFAARGSMKSGFTLRTDRAAGSSENRY